MTQSTDNSQPGYVGKPMDRVDGRLKVSGRALYAGEFKVHDLAHAVLVQSSIAKGRVVRLDTSEAERASGVLKVLTPRNSPPTAHPTVPPAGQSFPLLSEEVQYSGQTIALVVAETLEEAEYAASLVRAEYETSPPSVVMDAVLGSAFTPGSSGRPTSSKRGDYNSAISQASQKVDQVYRTPTEHHNPMEPHATIAIWDDDEHITAYDATQAVTNSAQNLAEQFGLPPEHVRVIDPFVGGGFGCKGQSWPNAPLAALAAKAVKRPVKVYLTRRQMFWTNGHRPETRQSLTLGAGADGKLVAIGAQMVNHTSPADEFLEPTGNDAASTYQCPNANIEQKLVRLNVPSPTYMRAPGESSGSFSIETAMDELAVALNLDPIELRLRNYAEQDPSQNRPYSSKSLRQCYEQASQAFGWSKRTPATRSMRDGRILVGYGMATATYPANFRPCSARARMFGDGTVLIQCGTQDLGTGTYTILTQVAADALGIPPNRIRVEIGDSSLPPAPGSGGSCSAASAGSAVHGAAQALRSRVIAYATASIDTVLSDMKPSDLDVKDGRVSSKSDPSKSMTYSEVLAHFGKPVVEQESFASPGMERGGYTMQGFGAQFCEVRVDPDFGSVRVARWVGAFAVGTYLNEKTIHSQLRGGIVFGIGMGLMEESVWDPRFGRIVNSSLAEYHVPVNLDVPPIEIILVPEKDTLVNPIGVKGAGEIGITGVAAAISNAVYHATGQRVRDLPITLDKVMAPTPPLD